MTNKSCWLIQRTLHLSVTEFEIFERKASFCCWTTATPEENTVHLPAASPGRRAHFRNRTSQFQSTSLQKPCARPLTGCLIPCQSDGEQLHAPHMCFCVRGAQRWDDLRYRGYYDYAPLLKRLNKSPSVKLGRGDRRNVTRNVQTERINVNAEESRKIKMLENMRHTGVNQQDVFMKESSAGSKNWTFAAGVRKIQDK